MVILLAGKEQDRFIVSNRKTMAVNYPGQMQQMAYRRWVWQIRELLKIVESLSSLHGYAVSKCPPEKVYKVDN